MNAGWIMPVAMNAMMVDIFIGSWLSYGSPSERWVMPGSCLFWKWPYNWLTIILGIIIIEFLSFLPFILRW